MPKQTLEGTLEEQCEFLYQLALEKMEAGNFTGAVHALQEIVKYAPDYKDAAEQLQIARQRKSEQTFLLIFSLIGAILFVGVGTTLGLGNDLWLFGFALVGLLIGYGAGNLLNSLRRT